MKKIIPSLIAIILFTSTLIIAQSPEAINYQGVARDVNGNPLISQQISVRFTIKSTSPTGTMEYQETHSATTNSLGLFTLQIGQGNEVVGNFTAIDWASDMFFVEVEVDPAGGGNYTSIGTSQLLSVPYALHAKTVEIDNVDDADADPNNELQNIVQNGGSATLSNGGGTITFDADSTNEIQTLSISNDTISLSEGGFIKIPPIDDADWNVDGNNLYSGVFGNVGIGTTIPTAKLEVIGVGLVVPVKAEGINGPTRAYLAPQGRTDFDSILTADWLGWEIGLAGISTGGSISDNFGVIGHSNNWGGRFENTNGNNYVNLGGINSAIQIVDGNQGAGKVLTSDASGSASWQVLATNAVADIDLEAGNAPAPTLTTTWLSDYAVVTITSSSQTVFWTASRAFGSTATGGANNLDLYPAYSLSTAPTPTTLGSGIWNLRCAQNTRQTYSVSGVISGLAPGIYRFGMAGNDGGNGNWNNNEFGYTSAIVLD